MMVMVLAKNIPMVDQEDDHQQVHELFKRDVALSDPSCLDPESLGYGWETAI